MKLKLAIPVAMAAGTLAFPALPAATPATAYAASVVAALTPSCDAPGLDDGRSCEGALAWAQQHVSTAGNPDYRNRCDHVMALAYGFDHSGSADAIAHWRAIPARYKHADDRDVPGGALVFFSGGSHGHVAISTGGQGIISTDIHGPGTFTRSSIDEITGRWGQHYLGWANPWFEVNH
ncbi:hypothetical protein [Actinoallomurus sp. CA-150999]|uniref:hypothetical protein n=1 Tax=Actinoallomurus sp. CA-150999 TaxID=3239887 RepID=UPI003D89B61E